MPLGPQASCPSSLRHRAHVPPNMSISEAKTPSRSFGAGTRNVVASGGAPTDAGTFSLWNVSALSELKIETRSATGLWNAGLGWDVISRISRMLPLMEIAALIFVPLVRAAAGTDRF